MSQTITTQPVHQPRPDIFQQPQFWGGSLLLVFCFVFLSLHSGLKNETSFQARFASGKELKAARRKGFKQVRNAKHNSAALYLGSNRRLWLPDAQRSMSVVGGSGSGKTYSCIDPAISSAIEQGWTMCVFDVKGVQMKRHAAHAISRGYQVYCFAPGFPYTDSLNLLDFMNDENDKGMASEIASVLNKNLKPPDSKEDAYFSPNGDALLTAMIMAAKDSACPDFLQVWQLLRLPELAERLYFAHQQETINPWVTSTATGVISVAGSADTVGGIVGSAVTNFGKIVDPQLLPALLDSNIPLDLSGKQLVFFQLDEQREASTSPLVAVAIHMLVTRNLNASVTRSCPFLICLDEFTSLLLPDIEKWINRNREYGQAIILGYQADSQLRQRYNRDAAQSILASCGTKIVFSPGVGVSEVSEAWSKSLGDREVKITTRSRSRGRHPSRGQNEQRQKVRLVTATEIEQMGQGECMILSPGYGFRPYRLKVKVSRKDRRRMARHEQVWRDQVEQHLIAYANKRLEGTNLDGELADRRKLAEMMLTHPKEIEQLQQQQETMQHA